MKRLLVLLVVLAVSSSARSANWEGAQWYTVYEADSAFIENLIGLNCSGDTVYLMPFGLLSRAELVRWSPNDVTETLNPPFTPIAVHGLNHADAQKRFPGLLQGPVLWRMTADGWDSTRVGSSGRYPHFFAVGPSGALHLVANDSVSAGVRLYRGGGGQAVIDTLIAPCIQMPYFGHWIGVDIQNNITCAVEEDFLSGEDLWIPCMKALRISEGSAEAENHVWRSVNRRYLQGIDGRWFVVRDLCGEQTGLVAEIYSGTTLVHSADILGFDYTFRLAQNPLDSLFEVAGMEREGSFAFEVQNEQTGGGWGNFYLEETPASIHAFHFMIDQFGYGHIFLADSNTIYRYGPPPQLSPTHTSPPLPQQLTLAVYPNPGNAEFRLSYSLARTGDVALKLYDVTGREVATLVNDSREAGEHIVPWNAGDEPSGVYFAVLRASGKQEITKLVLLK